MGIGVGWVIYVQIVLLGLLIVTILSVSIGCFWHYEHSGSDADIGFVGMLGNAPNSSTLNMWENMKPGYRGSYGWGSVFAIFFPAVTGIMAGANISGLLKNPAENIPKGTLHAIGWSTIVYCIMAFLIGAACTRSSLIEDPLIMSKIEIGWSIFVSAGIYAATFSSALASIVGAPQILSSVAKDGVFPILNFFAVTHGRTAFYKMYQRCPFVIGPHFRFVAGVARFLIGTDDDKSIL